MKALEVLLNVLISIINQLNKDGFKIYDENDRDYYIEKISYCTEDDRLIVSFKEDK
ncbi:hypothetical protein [Clostridium sp.]|uniref:hypothetical protein n=1 Tax=Clostridium sp. TaxID=1506 RepID=UPI0029068B8C|nr:hypothetical protein [Clostridium sp.]MDU5107156.1 hypothetical protein [Clostridium sp.]